MWKKGENAGFKHFFLFAQCFKMAFCSELLRVGNHFVKSKPVDKLTAFPTSFLVYLLTSISFPDDNALTLSHTSPGFYMSAVQVF